MFLDPQCLVMLSVIATGSQIDSMLQTLFQYVDDIYVSCSEHSADEPFHGHNQDGFGRYDRTDILPEILSQ